LVNHWSLEAKEEKSKNEEPQMSAGSSDDNGVSSDYNKVYFYSGVTRQDNLKLNKTLCSTSNKLLAIQRTYRLVEPPKIYLHINSYGGSVFAGFSTVDYIKTSKIPIVSVIDGCAASAATLMSVVAKERYMHEHAFMLIHQISSGMWGKYEELKDDMKNSDLLMTKIYDIYENHTKLPKSKIKQLLKKDLWWDAKTCLKYGLVDDILTP
jgi:ATP-dependent protease ClpP protease subunit